MSGSSFIQSVAVMVPGGAAHLQLVVEVTNSFSVINVIRLSVRLQFQVQNIAK